MLNKTKNSFAESMEKFEMESLRSKHRVMVSYLQFLYNRHSDLELQIISHVFSHKEGIYQQFIDNQYSEILAEPYCDQITRFLKNRGYPVTFMDYKDVPNNDDNYLRETPKLV